MNFLKSYNKSSFFYISIILFFWSTYFYTLTLFNSSVIWTLIVTLTTFMHITIIIFKNNDCNINFSNYKPDIKKIDVFIILSISIFIFILNFKFFNFAILFTGDEEGHISRAIRFFGRLKNIIFEFKYFFSIILLLLIIISIFLYFYYYKYFKINRYLLIFIIFCSSFFIFSFIVSIIKKDHFIQFRYPPFVTFLHGIFISLIPIIRYSELYNRLISFMPLIFTGILIYLYLKEIKINIYISFFTLLSFLTLPIIMYYYTVVYLEQFMILFITIPVLMLLYNFERKEEIINKNIIALVIGLSGFVKDTILPIIISFFIFYIILELLDKKNNLFKKIINLIIYFLFIFLPFIFYFSIRIIVRTRNHGLNFINLLNINLYKHYIKAIMEQFNPIVILIILITIIYSIINKKYLLENILALIIIIFNFLFFATDDISYAGYSRFNMGFVPSIIIYLILFSKMINQLKFKQKYLIFSIFFLFIITINFISGPFSFKKRMKFGNASTDENKIGETYYPYNELCAWIKKYYFNKTCFFYNPSVSEYMIDFYSDKYNIKIIELLNGTGLNVNKKYSINQLYEDLKDKKNQLLIVHNSLRAKDPKIIIDTSQGLKLLKNFCLSNNCIDIYLIN